MLAASVPTQFAAIWAYGASAPYINSIPILTQTGVKNGAASLADGFPPNCFIPYASGGAGPFGADFNGILQQLTAGLQWLQAGAAMPWNATFSAEVGGYPRNAIVASVSTSGLWWMSTADNNVTNPDASGAGWVAVPLALQSSLLTNGYAKLPNGLIAQWGDAGFSSLSAGYATGTFNFPIAFPNACLQITATDDGIGQASPLTLATYGAATPTTTNFVLTAVTGGNSSYTGAAHARYHAFGY